MTASATELKPASETASVPPSELAPGKEFVDYFKHRGREYKIFKRKQNKDAPWYVHYQFEGRRHALCAKTNLKPNALLYFKAQMDASWNGRLQELARERSEAAAATARCSTMGEFLAAVGQAPLDLEAVTRRQYVNALRNCIRRVKGEEVDVDGLPCSILDAEFVRVFFEQSIRRAREEQGQEAMLRAKRTANSVWNQAKALLRPKVIACLRRNGYVNADAKRVGLELPDFGGLEKVWQEERFEGVSKTEYHAPADGLARQTLRAWTRLRDRNHFLAVGLELAFGLRKAEAAQARWEWLTLLEGQPFLDSRAKVKNGSGRIQVRPLDPFWTVWRRRIAREQWEGKPGEFILEGTETERGEEVFRRIGKWMRELGWQTQKTNHAFRAYSGSQVAMRYGIYSASTWCRHSSVTVTEQHYGHFIEVHRMDGKRQIRRRWARAARGGGRLLAAA